MSLSLRIALRTCRRNAILWTAIGTITALALSTHLAAAFLAHGTEHAAIPGTTDSVNHQVLCEGSAGQARRCRFTLAELQTLSREGTDPELVWFTTQAAVARATVVGELKGTLITVSTGFAQRIGFEPAAGADTTRPGTHKADLTLLRQANDSSPGLGSRWLLEGADVRVAAVDSALLEAFELPAPIWIRSLEQATGAGVPSGQVWTLVAVPRSGSVAKMVPRLVRAASEQGHQMALVPAGPLHLDPVVVERARRLSALTRGLAALETFGAAAALLCISLLLWFRSESDRWVMYCVGATPMQIRQGHIWTLILLSGSGVLLGLLLSPLLVVTLLQLATATGARPVAVGAARIAMEGARIGTLYLLIGLGAGLIVAFIFRAGRRALRGLQSIMSYVLSVFIAAAIAALTALVLLLGSLAAIDRGQRNYNYAPLSVMQLKFAGIDEMYPTQRTIFEFYQALLEELGGSGRAVALATTPSPLTGMHDEDGIVYGLAGQDEARVKVARISQGFPNAISLPLLSGRLPNYAFADSGAMQSPREILINAELARAMGFSQPLLAVGHTLNLATLDVWETMPKGSTRLPAEPRTVVGVVDEGSSGAAANSKFSPLVRPLPPLAYLPSLQTDSPLLLVPRDTPQHHVEAAINKHLPGSGFTAYSIAWTMPGRALEDAVLRPDRAAFVLAGFAAAALTACGLLLVVVFLRFWINAQRRSLAIRFAIGASGGTVAMTAARQLAAPLTLGAAVGVLGCYVLVELSQGVISNQPTGLAVSIATAVAFIGALIASSVLPTLRNLAGSDFTPYLRTE